MYMIATVLILILVQTTAVTSDDVTVHQTPPYLMKKVTDNTNELSCSHSITDYDVILWYKQDRGGAMEFLGYINQKFPAVEDHWRGKFRFSGDGSRQSNLNIADLRINDSAVYFCAARTVIYLGPPAVTKKATLAYLGFNIKTDTCGIGLRRRHCRVSCWFHKGKTASQRRQAQPSQSKNKLTGDGKGIIFIGQVSCWSGLISTKIEVPLNDQNGLDRPRPAGGGKAPSSDAFAENSQGRPAVRLTAIRFDLPGSKIVHEASPVDFKCSHDDKRQDIMLWYRQSKGRRPIELVGYSHVGNEPFYERNDTRLEISRADTQRGSLSIGSVRASDTERWARTRCVFVQSANTVGTGLHGGSEAIFGPGTKLSVLEPDRDIALPTVTLLPPSRKECRSKDNEGLQKTLVCVATGFFPDHVEMSWHIDGETVKTGVATDYPALPDGAFYKMTSRLQVAADEWFTPGRSFTCLVSFFDGTDVIQREKTLYGIEGEKWSRARYLKLAQSAKLSYAVLLVKGSVYAAFVGFLLWRRQGRSAKRSHS
ncbi:uncharacterized protein LOC127615150 [Hippocampus zosterae]|uniref:uncharacterized protein LOC127615150 n=1 Tax=Hippocampus zosterae TaxID=109293 RepID=UPI00223E337C|nr:uncharacterized protein LOC127615150 [Hippocampus zosterae]